jgi:hypothetical protein
MDGRAKGGDSRSAVNLDLLMLGDIHVAQLCKLAQRAEDLEADFRNGSSGRRDRKSA